MIRVIKSSEAQVIPKKWGKEIIIHNTAQYCGKILLFNEGAKSSMHYHIMKNETWFVNDGIFKLTYIDPDNAERYEIILNPGDIIEVEKGNAHKLEAITDGEIFEVSTMHYDYDSYRVEKGDS